MKAINDNRAQFLLSLFIPGAGYFRTGRRGKGSAVLCMAGGILLSLFFSRSWITNLFLVFAYVMVVVPAALDGSRSSQEKSVSPVMETVPYILLMLFVTGLFGLPLLWQSTKFSRNVKILWTLVVVLLAALFLGGLIVAGPEIERMLTGP